MSVWISIGILVVSLLALIEGADVLITGARRIGARIGMSPFVIGVFIVGFGTSLPELASSLGATLSGNTEFVVATVVGSNIANILLITGVLTVWGGGMAIEARRVRPELPSFLLSAVIFVFVIADGTVSRIESLLSLLVFSSFVLYQVIRSRRHSHHHFIHHYVAHPAHTTILRHSYARDIALLLLGLIAITFGASYAVQSVVDIATALHVSVSIVTITAIAVGTSLPELVVSLRSLIVARNTDIAFGNILGSNVFNALVVTGVPGLIAPLLVDQDVTTLGIPILLIATVLLFGIGYMRRMTRLQGILFLLLFVAFYVALFS